MSLYAKIFLLDTEFINSHDSIDIKLNPNKSQIPAYYNILSYITKQTQMVQRSYIDELHSSKCAM